MTAIEARDDPCRVLIIEDDDDDAFLFQRALTRAGRLLNRKIECDKVDNGLDAIFLVSRQLTAHKLPDALVVDLNLPIVDGIKFLGCIRRSPLLKELPVFVLTTATAPGVHDSAMRAGADKVFIKPGDANALLDIVLEIIAAADKGRLREKPKAIRENLDPELA